MGCDGSVFDDLRLGRDDKVTSEGLEVVMKAQVFRGVNQLSYEEVPTPEILADEVLVQVQVVGLCQSDIKKIRYPLYNPSPDFWA